MALTSVSKKPKLLDYNIINLIEKFMYQYEEPRMIFSYIEFKWIEDKSKPLISGTFCKAACKLLT